MEKRIGIINSEGETEFIVKFITNIDKMEPNGTNVDIQYFSTLEIDPISKFAKSILVKHSTCFVIKNKDIIFPINIQCTEETLAYREKIVSDFLTKLIT